MHREAASEALLIEISRWQRAEANRLGIALPLPSTEPPCGGSTVGNPHRSNPMTDENKAGEEAKTETKIEHADTVNVGGGDKPETKPEGEEAGEADSKAE